MDKTHNDMACSVQHVEQSFGHLNVLKNLTCSLKKNKVSCIMGPSGCGKSVFLKVLLGLIPYQKGRIIMNPSLPRPGVVFQQGALFEHFYVWENAIFPMLYERYSTEECYQKAIQLLKMVGLSGFEHAYVWSLSGGMQRRLALARALSQHTSFLVLDEFTAGLDVMNARNMSVMLRDIIRQKEYTVFMVTHDVVSASLLADDIILMDRGSCVWKGSREEFFQSDDAHVAQYIKPYRSFLHAPL